MLCIQKIFFPYPIQLFFIALFGIIYLCHVSPSAFLGPASFSNILPRSIEIGLMVLVLVPGAT